MIGAEGFLKDRQGALEERFRFAVAALGHVEMRQVVERLPDIRMVGAEGFLSDRQRAFEERLRLAVAALGIVQHRQVVERLPDIRMVGAEGFLPDRQGALVERRACRAAPPRRSGFWPSTVPPGC